MEREKQGDKIRWYCMLSFPYKPGPLENKTIYDLLFNITNRII